MRSGWAVGAVMLTMVTTAAADAAPVRCAGRRATIVGTGEADVLEGTAGDDVVHGLGGADVIAGLGGDDLICTGDGGGAVDAGPGDDTVVGGPGNDEIAGRDGDDELRGGAAGDALAPGPGSDLVAGGPAGDLVSYGPSKTGVLVDLARGRAVGEGNDALASVEHALGSRFDDGLIGDAGRNVLVGLGGDDRIDALSGNDVVDGTEGDDTLNGHRGRDLVTFARGRGVEVDLAKGVATGQGRDTLRGFEVVEGSLRPDDLFGSSRGDTFLRPGSRDTVDGRGGTDVLSFRGLESDVDIDLGAGRAVIGDSTVTVTDVENAVGGRSSNVFKGDAGPNVYVGTSATDRFRDSGGRDVFHGRGGSDWVDLATSAVAGRVDLAAGTVAAVGRHRVTSTEHVTGSPWDDVLTGDAGNNLLLGAEGDDVVAGAGGFDQLSGNEGGDTVSGGTGDDYVDGGAGDDRIDAGDGLDVVLDWGGADEVAGGEGTDLFDLGDGPDSIDGGPGTDVIRSVLVDRDLVVDLAAGTAGGSGVDTLTRIEGVAGSLFPDQISGDASPNLLYGGRGGGDMLSGGGGDDLLETFAFGADDDLSGGDGDDYLFAGRGSDRADGGTGTDECWASEETTGCEGGESAHAPQFDPEFGAYEPSGLRHPRAVSAYVTRGGSVYGTVAELFALDECTGGPVHLERWDGAAWESAQTERPDGSGYRFADALTRSGRYRVRLPSTPAARDASTPQPNCMGAVSETFVYRDR